MKCIECKHNKATAQRMMINGIQGDFCDSCFKETKICRKCQEMKNTFEFEKNNRSIAGKVQRRGECRECRKWKRPISKKVREEFEKTNPQPPIGKPFHCPICDRTIIKQYKNDVVLDHFHDTGKIRGWICHTSRLLISRQR